MTEPAQRLDLFQKPNFDRGASKLTELVWVALQAWLPKSGWLAAEHPPRRREYACSAYRAPGAHGTMSLSYRPEVDGFRGLAIASVVLLQVNIPSFENGFVGVDIFFVILGFLITSFIAHKLTDEEFSYVHFVTRHMYRILPPEGSKLRCESKSQPLAILWKTFPQITTAAGADQPC